MSYEELKVYSLDRVKIDNISKYYGYRDYLEKFNLVKYKNFKFSIKFFSYILNIILKSLDVLNNSNLNVYYKNDLNNEEHSKLWWHIGF